MTDYKTLRVPVDAWEAAKEQKETAGRTWGKQIVRPDGEADASIDATAERLAQAIDHHPDFPTADVEAALRRVLRDELAEAALDGGRA